MPVPTRQANLGSIFVQATTPDPTEPPMSEPGPTRPTPCPPSSAFRPRRSSLWPAWSASAVLTTSGFTVYDVGSNQLMLVVWVVGGIAAAAGAHSLRADGRASQDGGGLRLSSRGVRAARRVSLGLGLVRARVRRGRVVGLRVGQSICFALRRLETISP